MEMNDDVNLTAPENNDKAVETPENNITNHDNESAIKTGQKNQEENHALNHASPEIKDAEENHAPSMHIDSEEKTVQETGVHRGNDIEIDDDIEASTVNEETADPVSVETPENCIPGDHDTTAPIINSHVENEHHPQDKENTHSDKSASADPVISGQEDSIHSEAKEPVPIETEAAKTLAKAEEKVIEEKIINTDQAPVKEMISAISEPEPDEAAAAIEQSEVSTLNFDSLSKAEIVKAAQDAVQSDNLRDASDRLKALRTAYENVQREEQQKALAEYIEGGGERDGFSMPHDSSKYIFYATFEILKKRKEEQRQQIEKQKQDNLKLKQDILDKIKAIVDGEESKDSIEQIKFLQSEWKRIKVIPQEHAQKLWDTYSFYIDKFYDNRSIFYELKELDRQKNLAAKIELCLRVDELKKQTSMKQCMMLLNKYHEDWKSIGPVPKEVSEELWQRFKGASDIIHEIYRAYLTELEGIQTVNLQKKKELVEKAQEIAKKPIEKGKDWNERSKEYEALLAEWKTIGMVPREHNNIWDNFRGIIDEFYKQKNNHFKEMNKGRMENYRKKEELCLKAEALKDSTEWGRTSKELVKLQEDWKTIGAVPDKYNESIWKRFRAACDAFFNTKNEKFASQKTDHANNLEIKNAIISKLEELSKTTDYSVMANEVRAAQDEWNATGHVDIKIKDSLYKKYNAALDALYDSLRKNSSEFEQTQNKQRFEQLANQPEGKFRLQSEGRKLQDRIRVLQEANDTLQNNIGFFANSKNAESLKKKVEEDIAANLKNITKLKEQLQVLKGLQNA